MKKFLAAVVCAVALVGCGGPLDENDTTGANQDALVMPDGVPSGDATVDQSKLNLIQVAPQARQSQFADSHPWSVTEQPHHCGH
jgi:uncharacterized protein YcfL